MASYRYGVRRSAAENIRPLESPVPAAEAVVEPTEPAAPEPSYRELQAEAKALGIAANQSTDELKQAIAEHSSDE